MKLGINISLQAATIAGHDAHGWQVIDLPSVELSAEDRETLAGEATPAVQEDWRLQMRHVPWGAPKEPEASHADHVAVRAWLAWARSVRQFIGDAEQAEADAIVAQHLVLRDALVADPLACVRRQEKAYGPGLYVDLWVGAQVVNKTHPVRERAGSDPALSMALQIADQEVARLLAEEESRRAAVVTAREAQEASAQADRRAAVEWIVSTGTPSQVERHRAGVLPEVELLNLLSGIVFSEISDPKYQEISAIVLSEHEQSDLLDLTESQYSAVKRVHQLLQATEINSSCKVTYVIATKCHTSRGTYGDGGGGQLVAERHSLKIDAAINGTDLVVSRLLDLDALS